MKIASKMNYIFSRKIKEKLTQRIFSPFSLLKVAINQKTYFKKD